MKVPSLSEIFVMVYSEELRQRGIYIVEKKRGESLAYLVARVLLEPRNGKVPIRLLNPKTEVVVFPKHVQVGMIELVNVPLGVVANTPANPVQYDSNLDEFLWHVVEESGAEINEEQKEKLFLLLENTVMFSLNPVLILGELAGLSMKYTLVTALQLCRVFVGSLLIIGSRCRSFCIVCSKKE